MPMPIKGYRKGRGQALDRQPAPRGKGLDRQLIQHSFWAHGEFVGYYDSFRLFPIFGAVQMGRFLSVSGNACWRWMDAMYG